MLQSRNYQAYADSGRSTANAATVTIVIGPRRIPPKICRAACGKSHPPPEWSLQQSLHARSATAQVMYRSFSAPHGKRMAVAASLVRVCNKRRHIRRASVSFSRKHGERSGTRGHCGRGRRRGAPRTDRPSSSGRPSVLSRRRSTNQATSKVRSSKGKNASYLTVGTSFHSRAESQYVESISDCSRGELVRK